MCQKMSCECFISLIIFLIIIEMPQVCNYKLKRQKPPNTTLKEKCYEDLGCVQLSSEWFHPRYRPVNVLPSDRHAVNTIFVHWNLQDQKLSSKVLGELNVLGALKILIHDFTSNGYAGWIQHLSRALLIRSSGASLNVISVDWAAGAEPPYYQAVANSRLVALEVTQFLNKLKTQFNVFPSRVHIIGHGLGAHIAGYVGKLNRLRKITALDPSGPYFINMPPHVRLHRDDAALVEVVHSDNMPFGQGYPAILGHIDFFPNGGKQQPGCIDAALKVTSLQRDSLKLGETLSACSHKRSLKYFIEALMHPTCSMLGFACENYKQFLMVCVNFDQTCFIEITIRDSILKICSLAKDNKICYVDDDESGKCTSCGDKMQNCARLAAMKSKSEVNNTYGLFFVTSNSAPFCSEILKVLLVLKRKNDNQPFVKGYFNVSIPQSIGDVRFYLNENSAVNALNTDDHHVFLVFRAVPPPLLLPAAAVHVKWVHGSLPAPWACSPKVTGFMLYKMTERADARPQWFCLANNSPEQSLGLGLEPCDRSCVDDIRIDTQPTKVNKSVNNGLLTF